MGIFEVFNSRLRVGGNFGRKKILEYGIIEGEGILGK